MKRLKKILFKNIQQFSFILFFLLVSNFLYANDFFRPNAPVFIQASDRQLPCNLIGKSEYPVRSVAWSPDGRRYLSTWRNFVLLWNGNTNKLLTVCTGHKSNVIYVCFSPDGRYFLSLSEDNTIIVRYTQTCKDALKIRGDKDAQVLSAIFTNDTSSVVVPLDGETLDYCFRLLMTKEFLLNKMEGHTSPIYSLDYSTKTNKLLSASTDGVIRLWDLRDFECEGVYDFYSKSKVPVKFTPDGEGFLSVEKKDTIVYRNFKGTVLLRIREPEIASNSMAFSPDGNSFAIALKNGNIRTYDLKTGLVSHYLECETKNEETAGPVTSLCYNSDGRQILAGTSKGYLFKWSLNGGFLGQAPEDPFGLDDDVRKRVGEVLPTVTGEKVERDPEQEKDTFVDTSASATQAQLNKGKGPARSEIFLGLGYSILPSEYYIGSFDFDFSFQKNIIQLPIFFALETRIGAGVPSKSFPYTYYFADSSRAKNPWLYSVKPGVNVGFKLYSTNDLRVFVDITGGLTYRALWNNNPLKSVSSDLFKGYYAGLSAGTDWHNMTVKFDCVYDSILGVQPAISVGYTIKNYEKLKIEKNKENKKKKKKFKKS